MTDLITLADLDAAAREAGVVSIVAIRRPDTRRWHVQVQTIAAAFEPSAETLPEAIREAFARLVRSVS